MNIIRFANLFGFAGNVANVTRIFLGEQAMLAGRLLVYVVAGKARRPFLAQHGHGANVFHYVAIHGIQSSDGGGKKIDVEIAKQIVAGHEVIGVRQAACSRPAAANMALPANGDDHASRVMALLGKVNERGVFGVVDRGCAMAGIAIKRRTRERMSGRIDARRVAARAADGELVPVPMRHQPRLNIALFVNCSSKQIELAVAGTPFQEPRALVAAQEKPDLAGQ